MIWDRFPKLTLLLLSAALFFGLGAATDAFGLALGTDARLWGLNALNLRVGASPFVTPGFPAILALLSTVVPLQIPELAQIVNGAAIILLPLGVWTVARRLGATPRAALLAGLLSILDIRVLIFGLQLQPDALSLWVLLLAVPLLLWYDASPTPARTAAMLLYLAFAYLIREHGLLLAAAVAGWLFIRPGPWPRRLILPALVALTIVLAPALVGETPCLPWKAPWFARVAMAGQGSENLRVDPSHWDAALVAGHIRAHELNQRMVILVHHALNSQVKARGAWLLLLGGLLSIWEYRKGGRLPLLMPLATALPALVIMSQDRHVLIVVPLALAILAGASAKVSLVRMGWTAALLGTVVNLLCSGIPLKELDHQVDVRGDMKEVSKRICEIVGPNDLMTGEITELTVYCPVRHTNVPVPNTSTGPMAWKVWLIAQRMPRDTGWSQVFEVPEYGALWRYRADLSGAARPCEDSVPLPDTPYAHMPPSDAVLDPPCTAPLQDE